MAGRPRKTKLALKSMDDCAAAMHDLLIAITDLEALAAERDQAVAAASAKFEFSINDARQRHIDNATALQDYYYSHLAELERGGGKHCQLPNGIMGRRDNPPALKPLNRQWTWAAITARVRDLFGGAHFHPAKEPVLDKDSLKTLPTDELKKVGLKLESEETFYVEPARLPKEAK